jgi:hypothetical protein
METAKKAYSDFPAVLLQDVSAHCKFRSFTKGFLNRERTPLVHVACSVHSKVIPDIGPPFFFLMQFLNCPQLLLPLIQVFCLVASGMMNHDMCVVP